MFKELCKIGNKIGNIILSFLFPKEPLIEHLENLSPAEFKRYLEIIQMAASTVERTTSPTEPWIHALLPYKNKSVEKIIHDIKYYHNENLAEKLAIEISAEVARKFPVGFFGTIIPLPPRKKRLIEYGFDQNVLVLSYLPKQLISRVNTRTLTRNDTAEFSHTKMKRAERLASATQIYKLHPDYNPKQSLDQPVIIYDDVTTTGASLQDARRCLMEIGISQDKIIAITLAH